MREIKFRVWDIKEKRFWSEEEMNEIGGFYYTYRVAEFDPEEFVLLQFTGLYDKNETEIYEDDVVINEQHGEGKVEFFTNLNWDGGGSVHSGFYVKEWFDYPGDDSCLSYHEGFDGCEIIGNIMENSSLISKEKP